MAIVFDPEKNARNIAARGLNFELVERFEWDSALVKEDTRKDYGEVRLQILALLDGRLYAAVVTPRGSDLRVISLRKASRKEVGYYEQKIG
jgi:uncharacterized DUF497 family protein